jgi:hypothetical protein
VHYLRIEPEIPFAAVLVRAIHLARAPIVALLEEHCIAMPRWAAALVKAHEEPWGAVCGEVINSAPGVGISDAEFMAGRTLAWHSPAERGQLDMLDGYNTAYRRDLLLGYGDEALTEMLAAGAITLLKLREDGHRLLLEPAAQYIHCNEAQFKTLSSALFHAHRALGGKRAKVFHWSLPRRIRQLFIALLTPPYQSLGNLRYIRRKRPDLLRPFLLNLPLILLLGYCSNFGQMVGLLFGEGDSVEKFSKIERGQSRRLTIELPPQIAQR